LIAIAVERFFDALLELIHNALEALIHPFNKTTTIYFMNLIEYGFNCHGI